ncbi:hypothetical protein DM860_016420 [Cuscuta australis]|uniref:Uncharacterized protein n=1 Tax=Cuscuta australis TaxID=267555 RepID=A0A328DF71_9ASTE|nr:hypothetical protein DM860_016420 [Cuscuta australis]
MSGMLPGVECARRRRFHHHSNNNNNKRVLESSFPIAATRKSFCCLYTTNSSSSSSSNPLMEGRGLREGHDEDDKRLGEVARGAKQRLDEKLMRVKWKPHHNWNSVHKVEFGLKSTGPAKCNWARKLGF